MSRKALAIFSASLCLVAFNNCGGGQGFEPIKESGFLLEDEPPAPDLSKPLSTGTGYRYEKSPLLDEALVCKRMTEGYGYAFVPIIIDDKIECFAQHTIQPYFESAPAYRNTEYFYAFPPFTGQGCKTNIDLGFDGILSVCLFELKKP